MNIRNDVTTKAIDVNIQAIGVAQEEFFFLLLEDTLRLTTVGRKGNIG